MSVQIPNESQLRRTQAGTHAPANRGLAVTPTFKLYGDMQVNRAQPLADYTEYDGSFDADILPVRGAVTVDGTYAQNLTYEDFPILLRYGVKGQVAGVTDGQSTPGFTYTYAGTASRDDIDVATVEYGFPGMPFKCEMLHFPEFTISGDIDDAEAAWKWASNVWARTKDRIVGWAQTAATSATSTVITKTGMTWTVNQFAGAFIILRDGALIGQVREIASNTATTITVVTAFSAAPAATVQFEVSGGFTAGIADRTRETINAPGTKLYIDPTTIGTTQVLGKLISFSVTNQINSYGKRFMEDVSSYSTKLGRGKRRISGIVRMEFDDWQEYDRWIALDKRLVRIQQEGTVINVSPETKKLAQINIPNCRWDAVTMDERESNITASFAFRSFKDAVAGYAAQYVAKTALSTLP